MKKYYPQAVMYEDKNGMFTLHISTKEEAQKYMQGLIDEERNDLLDPDEQENRIEININDIKEDRMYGHRKCDGVMIGEAICWGCGEPCHWRGRKTFTYNLD